MKPRIIIIGAGFAGLSALITLERHLDADILLFDRDPFFEYTPSLHLVLGDRGKEGNIILDLKRFPQFRHEEVLSISKDKVHTAGATYPFDYLIVATGSGPNFYGNTSFEENAIPFKRLKDVRLINAKLVSAKNIAVVGGGYTGVEVSSILASLPGKHVHLIHAGAKVLDSIESDAGAKATSYLQRKGVRLHLNSRVERCARGRIVLDSGFSLASDLTIMTAGVKPNDTMLQRPELDTNLALKANDRIFLAGDAGRSGLLLTAHNAMIEGRAVAASIIKRETKREVKREHKDWRTLAIALGRYNGIITLGKRAPLLPVVGFGKWLIERAVMFEFVHGLEKPI